MALSFTETRPSTVTLLAREAQRSTIRGRLIRALVLYVWPLTMAVLAVGLVMMTGVNDLFGWHSDWLTDTAFGAAAATALLTAVRPSSALFANAFVVTVGWAFLGRAWSVWTGETASGMTGWAQVVGGTTWAAITLGTLLCALVHVALLLSARSASGDRERGPDPR